MSNPPSIALKNRVLNLSIALGLFTLLYTLTNNYSQSLENLLLHNHQPTNQLFISKDFFIPKALYTLATPQDRTIPFIAAFIVPYSWSFILFCLSFFLVKTPKQLSNLTRRLIVSTLIGCCIFYLFPAKFSFDRPVTEHWTNFGYQLLNLTDKPYNQAPSLHVAYAIVLGASLWPAFKSKLHKLLLIIICVLITVSTVFTYQHHVLDVVGGGMLAAITLTVTSKLKNNQVLKYLTLALTGFMVLAMLGFNLSVKFATPVIELLFILLALYWLISFFAVSYAYQKPSLTLNRKWFKKDPQGKLTLATWMRFAPLLSIYYGMSGVGQAYERYLLKKWQKNKLTTDQSAMDITKQHPLQKAERKSVQEPKQKNIRSSFRPNAINFMEQPKHFGIAKASETHPSVSSNQTVFPNQAIWSNKTVCYSLSTPKLSADNIKGYQSILHSKQQRLDQLNLQSIIVVDVAAEVSSHFCQIKSANINYEGLLITTMYLPLLDLQSFAEIKLADWTEFIEKLATIINSQQMKLKGGTQLINFQCAMGLSRSVAIEVLYLLYCGKLTIENYEAWVQSHYPFAKLPAEYLPKRLLEQISQLNLKTS